MAGRPRAVDNVTWVEHKKAKREFSKEIRRVSREYENQQILQAVKDAELNKNSFWKVVKKCRNPSTSCVTAIKNDNDKAVYESDEILQAWHEHFSRLCMPADDASFDAGHYELVSERVRVLNKQSDGDQFTDLPFTFEEVQTAIKKLHLRKASGFDNISAEHIRYAGPNLVFILKIIYNLIVEWEYIPVNFRRGTQVPLYKGKNTCTLDRNNYRGITLLTNFNKIFEILLWGRIEKWWTDSGAVSMLQGACRKKQSCVHTAYLLQETVSSALENNGNVFVAFFDVSKAFDTVWVDGLFYKLNEIGIVGRVWRILYRTYQDFLCRVRVKGKFSEWYPMRSGIHQGGFLSLIKYTVFIDAMITELEMSGLCCTVQGIPSTPPGYADDVATACLSKHKIDKVLGLVDQYGKKWRFRFNAKKSAILVFGEDKKINAENSKYRVFKLGNDKVPEKIAYDHVGVKVCVYNDNDRVNDKIVKGRRTLNACAGIGIRRNGLTMLTCNIIFWAIIVPIITFGSEIWSLSDHDCENLQKFQVFSGRRIQRFPPRSPTCSSYFGLGWTRITTYIMIKKLLFVMSILRLDDNSLIKKVFINRVHAFINDRARGILNQHNSPTFSMLNTAVKFGVLSTICDMVTGKNDVMPRKEWSKMIWDKATMIDDVYWESTKMLHHNNDLLHISLTQSRYLEWWALSDKQPHLMKICENMARMVCHSSRLKCDDYRLKSLPPSHRNCNLCDMYVVESLFHITMQCPYFVNERNIMYNDIYAVDNRIRDIFKQYPELTFRYIIGKCIPGIEYDTMCQVWTITGTIIDQMYQTLLRNRQGIG